MTITDYYVTTDAMGSVTAILDEEGNVLERRSYDAFGEMTCMTPDGTPVAECPTGVDVGFQGQVRDEVAGLYQMGYRWYNPVLGRWLSRDPIGLVGGFNCFDFAHNKPTEWSDPLGLDPVGLEPPPSSQPSTGGVNLHDLSAGLRRAQPVPPAGGSALSLTQIVANYLSAIAGLEMLLGIHAIEKGHDEFCKPKRELSSSKAAKGCGCCVLTLIFRLSHPFIPQTTRVFGPLGFYNSTILVPDPRAKVVSVKLDELLYIPRPCDKLSKHIDYESSMQADQQAIRKSLTWSV